jgi:hypothetical protein
VQVKTHMWFRNLTSLSENITSKMAETYDDGKTGLSLSRSVYTYHCWEIGQVGGVSFCGHRRSEVIELLLIIGYTICYVIHNEEDVEWNKTHGFITLSYLRQHMTRSPSCLISPSVIRMALSKEAPQSGYPFRLIWIRIQGRTASRCRFWSRQLMLCEEHNSWEHSTICEMFGTMQRELLFSFPTAFFVWI